MIQRKSVCYVQTPGVLEGRVAVGVPAGRRVLGGVELLGYALREEGLWLGPARRLALLCFSARARAPLTLPWSRGVWNVGRRRGGWEGKMELHLLADLLVAQRRELRRAGAHDVVRRRHVLRGLPTSTNTR